MVRLILAAASALTLAACAVGPNYVRPTTPPAAAAPFLSTSPAVAGVEAKRSSPRGS